MLKPNRENARVIVTKIAVVNKKNIERIYKRIESLVLDRKLKDALDVLKDLVINSRKGEFISQYESLDNTYENLLKYAISGVKDPEREKIYNKLLVSVLELADVALQYAYMSESEQYVYKLKKKIEFENRQVKDEALNNLESLAFDKELSDVLQDSLESGRNEREEYDKHHDLLIRIFNIVWLTDKFNESDENLLHSIWQNQYFPWHEKAVVVSALTLSAIRCFDSGKIGLLLEFATDKNMEIRYRALTGLFVTLYLYNQRLHLYPALLQKISYFIEENEPGKDFERIAIQLIKSKETEKITKKLQEEILPEMVKYQPVLRDKLDLDNILSDDFMDDKNPDWETVFEDAPDLLDKLQEISKLQLEGSDVFMSAFSRLKHFGFFNEIVNWFRPFYKDNPYLQEVLKNEDEKIKTGSFLEGLEESIFMCNSDKFSFCLNIPNMPQMQKSMMFEMFNAELESLKELQQEEDILNTAARETSIISRYVHDLYRFYKLHPLKSEFLDIFTLPFDFFNNDFISILVNDQDILRNIAEFLFEKGYYENALSAYQKLNQQGDVSLEVFEKTGYCHQQLKQFENALEFYKKAELFDANRAWNLKKIALCYRFTGNFKESLHYYLEAAKLEPDNIYVLTYIGHAYLDLKQFDKALESYYKVEFLAEENKKVLRPIAWCSFVLGKMETAKKYYERLLEDEANRYDFMNLGHVEWCLGNSQAALKNYKLSVTKGENNLKAFMAGFDEDKQYLIKHGIKPDEIPLMIDYLKYQL